MSPEHGIMNAVAYGAYSAKGKLRSITNPLCAGTFFLYRDPVKDVCKVSDFDCREFFEGTHASIVKFFTASVWLETVLKTFGGDSRETFSLLMNCLRLLDGCPENVSSRLLVQFIWRYLEMSGTHPDSAVCSGCGKCRKETEGFLYRRGNPGFFCADCADTQDRLGTLEVSSGALKYLQYSRNTALEKAIQTTLDSESFNALKKILFFMIEDLAGGSFNSIRTGSGVL